MIPKSEKRKAQKAFRALSENIRLGYLPQYGTGIGNIEGEFLGLICAHCKCWQDAGHDQHCLVDKKIKEITRYRKQQLGKVPT